MTDIHLINLPYIHRIKMVLQNDLVSQLSLMLERFESMPICPHICGWKSSRLQRICSIGNPQERSISRHHSRSSRPARVFLSKTRALYISRSTAAEPIRLSRISQSSKNSNREPKLDIYLDIIRPTFFGYGSRNDIESFEQEISLSINLENIIQMIYKWL